MQIRVLAINQDTGEETETWKGDYLDFREANAQHDDELDKWGGMLRGPIGRVYVGGGAEQLFLLIRVSR